MKKIIVTFLILVFLIGNTYAVNYKITSSDKRTINKISYKIQNLLDKNNLVYREKLLEKINEIQNKYKNNIQFFTIFEEIKNSTNLINYSKEYTNHYKISNINFSRIKDSWLSWHNQARKDLGRNLYTYDQRLDNTAYEWSKEQESKGIMSHKRTSNAPFYDYKQIEKWFNVRGVRCIVSGGATASESIGKFGYYCSDGECTDELTKSIKVIFDIYMAEKGLAYPANAHYKGIILPELSKIGLGISIRKTNEKDYYEYYITTHYCTKFKN